MSPTLWAFVELKLLGRKTVYVLNMTTQQTLNHNSLPILPYVLIINCNLITHSVTLRLFHAIICSLRLFSFQPSQTNELTSTRMETNGGHMFFKLVHGIDTLQKIFLACLRFTHHAKHDRQIEHFLPTHNNSVSS